MAKEESQEEDHMSTNPPNMRQPVNVRGLVPDAVAEALEHHDDQLVDLSQAIPELKSQIDALSPSTAASSTTENVTSISEEIIQAPQNFGFVNNQTGVTAYTTVQSDSSSLIVLNDASAIAVTLSVSASAPGIQVPWSAAFLNLGVGTATLTPATGTINYAGNLAAASMPIKQGQFALVWYDGTSFWAFLATLAPSGLSVTITTAALTTLGTQGSMTYLAGILTAQVPAT